MPTLNVATTRSTLSVAASAVGAARGHFSEEMPDMYGYSSYVSEGTITRVLAELGWTVEEYNDALEAATSAKYVWRSGLDVDPFALEGGR